MVSLALALALGAAPSATASDIVTPGNFTGYGFDQCLAPTQTAMNRWLNYSPFLAVGIYISGDSRACRVQPNLSRTWVDTQLRRGWRLLPITLGPQASCQPRFPRYGDDETIKPRPGANGNYAAAGRQGRDEAIKSVAAASALGIKQGSTLWYDLEGFDSTKQRCRESALRFLSGWTWKLRQLGWVSGVYSSAGSGIKMLDDARVNRPDAFNLPDRIWIARWDGLANTSTSYIRPDGWLPGGRMKQYQGGHDEVWGGVRINIDRNYLDLGRGSVARRENHCNATTVDFGVYDSVTPSAADPVKVQALKCLLTEKGTYTGRVNGVYTPRLMSAIKAWQSSHGLPVTANWWPKAWMTLLSAGPRRVVKIGSAGSPVRRLQRSLNAAGVSQLKITGIFNGGTRTAVLAWQKRAGLARSGVISGGQWKALQAGKR
jgi:Rv2525c-like, glycoside hydrolase-like domain/Putative peptidoglycan binding domain